MGAGGSDGLCRVTASTFTSTVLPTLLYVVRAPYLRLLGFSLYSLRSVGKALSLMNIIRDLVSIAGRGFGGHLLSVNLEYPSG